MVAGDLNIKKVEGNTGFGIGAGSGFDSELGFENGLNGGNSRSFAGRASDTNNFEIGVLAL